MKVVLRFLILLVIVIGAPALLSAGRSARNSSPLRVLVVTGGHDFEREPFFEMFQTYPNLRYEETSHPNAHALLTPANWSQYDAILLYDMWQPITEEAQKQFVSLLKRGKGLVVLHHAMCSYNDWPEYRKIIGGRFRVKMEGDKEPSKFEHDIRYKVTAKGGHPVTAGIKDFRVFDETYIGYDIEPKVRPLLTTDESTSEKLIGWAHSYANSRVVTIQPGHGPTIFENSDYRKLIYQAIKWVAEREDE